LAGDALSKTIVKQWWSLPQQEKTRFYDLASKDDERYQREMGEWRKKQKDEYEMKPYAQEPQSPRAVSETHSVEMEGVNQGQLQEERASQEALFSFSSSESFAPPFASLSPSVSDLDLMASQPMIDITTETPQVPHAPSAAGIHNSANDQAGLRSFPHSADQYSSQHQRASSLHSYDYNEQCENVGLPIESIGDAPGFMSERLLSGQVQEDPPPKAMIPVAPGIEITMPDQNGVKQNYKVNYSCYLVTQDQAKEYAKTFGDCPLHVGPPPVLANGALPLA